MTFPTVALTSTPRRIGHCALRRSEDESGLLELVPKTFKLPVRSTMCTDRANRIKSVFLNQHVSRAWCWILLPDTAPWPVHNLYSDTHYFTIIFPATELRWHNPHLWLRAFTWPQFHSLTGALMVLRTATRQQRRPPLIFVLQSVSWVHIIVGSLLFTSPSVHNARGSPHEDHCERSPLFAEYNMTPPTVW